MVNIFCPLFKNPTHALCFTIHIKTHSLFQTLECLRLLCHPTCFGHTLDHSSGDVPCTMLLSALLLLHNFTWACGRIFCNIMFNNTLQLIKPCRKSSKMNHWENMYIQIYHQYSK